MTLLWSENFDTNGWVDRWSGRPLNGYPVNQGSDPDREVRILFRQGSHYGTDYRRPLGKRVRKGSLTYGLYLSGDWNPSDTGKLPGVLDTRHEPFGYGNNKPNPHGGSIRTWFGGPSDNRKIGLYVYHEGQGQTWGDSVKLDTPIPMWVWVDVHIKWDMNAGTASIGVVKRGGSSLGYKEMTNLAWSSDTAFDAAWLCGYHGGSQTSPSNMAADVDDMVAYDLDTGTPPTPGPDPTNPYAAELRGMGNRLLEIADEL